MNMRRLNVAEKYDVDRLHVTNFKNRIPLGTTKNFYLVARGQKNMGIKKALDSMHETY